MPVIDISELPQNLHEIEASPVRPGMPPAGAPPAKNDIPNYFSGTIAPQLQHDGTFVGMKYGTPGIPSHPIMPVAPSGQAAANATVTSVINKTTVISTITPDPQTSEMNWRGKWVNSTPYAIDDVVQFNISTYLALSANVNVKPDQNPGTWALVSKNFNFRGPYGSGGPNYPSLQYWSQSTTFSLSTTFQWTVNPALATWAPVHVYTLGTKIIDSNGNQQTVITAGTSQPTSHPTWNTLVGGQTIDNAGPSQVVWVCGGTANSITIGDVLFMATRIDPLSGTATTTSVTDTSGNTWSQIGTTESYVSGLNGKTYTLQLWTTVATVNVASGGTYKITVNNSASSDGTLSLVGFSSAVGTLSQSTSATSSGTGPLTPGPISLETPSFLIYSSSTDHTSSFGGGTPPWNFVNSGGGAFELDLAWATFGPGVSNPPTSSPGGGGLCATQSSFVNLPAAFYVPFDVVIYKGSTYVCIAETNATPLASPSSWALLSQGTGSVINLSSNYSSLATDDGKLVTNTTSSNFTLTLLASPPTPWWWIAVQNSGTGTIVINPNGLQLDGSSSNLTLVQNQGVLIYTDGSNYFTERGFGTVFSVALSMPGIFNVAGSPITGSGTLSVTLANEPANQGFFGPTSGAAAPPTFRSLVPADMASGFANQSLEVNGIVYSDDYEVDVNGDPEITVNGSAPGAEMPSRGTGFGAGTPGTAVTTTTLGAGTGPANPQTIVKYVKLILDGVTYWAALMQ